MRLIVACTLFTTFAGAAAAQDYPVRPIELVVGFGAGSGADNITRFIGREIEERVGSPVVVINAPGASQLIAINRLTSADPDGYTLLMTTASALAGACHS